MPCMPLESPAEVVKCLRAATTALSLAHRAAGEREGERTNLNGLVRDIIFGLNTAVDSLSMLVEQQMVEELAQQDAQCDIRDCTERAVEKVVWTHPFRELREIAVHLCEGHANECRQL
jgi:hypothetical protein